MGRATTRDETVRKRDESGQDITNTPPPSVVAVRMLGYVAASII